MERIASLAAISNDLSTAQTENPSFPLIVVLAALLLFAVAARTLTLAVRQLAQIAIALARLSASMLLVCMAALLVIILVVGSGLHRRAAELPPPDQGTTATPSAV